MAAAVENLEISEKKLKDYGARRIIAGNRNRCPLTSVELIDLYINYLGPRSTNKIMDEQEFEVFCCDFKRLLPKSRKEKLQGTGYIALKQDLMALFTSSRRKFNARNKQILDKAPHGLYRDDPNHYQIKLKDDEVGLEDLARFVCVEQNYLLRRDLSKYFTGGTDEKIPKDVCEMIFQHYDQNGSAWLSQTEIMGLLRDIFSIQRMKEEMVGKPISTPKEIADLMDYTDEMCIKFSTNLDGMLTYGELENLLNQTQRKK